MPKEARAGDSQPWDCSFLSARRYYNTIVWAFWLVWLGALDRIHYAPPFLN
jgi:hypothetical protein